MHTTIPVEMCGRTLKLKPTFKALLDIEEELGESFFEVGSSVSGKAIMAILYHGLKAGGNEIARITIEEELSRKGIRFITPAISDFFMLVLEGEGAGSQQELPESQGEQNTPGETTSA